MPLAELWTELSLSTKSFQSGLTTAQGLAQAWGRKVGGDIRNTFFSALNPARFLQSTVSSVQQAIGQIGEVTDAAGAVREEIEGPPLDPRQEEAVRVLADRLGLSLQSLAALFRETTLEGAEFRGLLSALVTESDTQKVDDFWAAWRRGLSESWSVVSLSRVSRFLNRLLDPLGATELGQALIDGEQRVKELEKRLRDRAQAAKEQEEKEKRWRAKDREEVRDEVRGLRDRGGRMRDFAGQVQGGVTAGGLAQIGGFTAGAGLASLSIQRQQLRVLEIVKMNTDVMRRAADLEMQADALE